MHRRALLLTFCLAAAVLPAAQAEDVALNTVRGTVANAAGVPQPGADVVVELVPSGGYRISGGAHMHVVTSGVTDRLGGFALQIPTTGELLAEAEYLNGRVNMMVHVMKTKSEGSAWSVMLGAGGFYTSMVEFGPGAGAVALAPVNVGLVTIEETKSLTGTTGLAEVPGNDPYDPATPVQPDTSPDLPSGVGATVGTMSYDDPTDGAVDGLVVEPPMSDTHVALPPTLPETPADPGVPEGDEHSNGDDRCRRPANQGRWLVDQIGAEYRWQPVGEVHSITGLNVQYVYSQSAKTELGMAINTEGKGWKVSGETIIANDSSAQVTLPVMHGTFARKVEAEFYYVKNFKTWCPQGYDTDRGPYATHMHEIKALRWQGGVQYGSSDLGQMDSKEHYEAAVRDGRKATLRPGAEFEKTEGRSYKYTFGVSAFGVGLNAESLFDTKHKLILKAGTSRDEWHYWGDVGSPPSPANHAIYTYI